MDLATVDSILVLATAVRLNGGGAFVSSLDEELLRLPNADRRRCLYLAGTSGIEYEVYRARIEDVHALEFFGNLRWEGIPVLCNEWVPGAIVPTLQCCPKDGSYFGDEYLELLRRRNNLIVSWTGTDRPCSEVPGVAELSKRIDRLHDERTRWLEQRGWHFEPRDWPWFESAVKDLEYDIVGVPDEYTAQAD